MSLSAGAKNPGFERIGPSKWLPSAIGTAPECHSCSLPESVADVLHVSPCDSFIPSFSLNNGDVTADEWLASGYNVAHARLHLSTCNTGLLAVLAGPTSSGMKDPLSCFHGI